MSIKSLFTKVISTVRSSFEIKTRSELVALIVLLTVCLGLSSHLWFGDVLFHTDLARDFLVLDDIIQTRKITLIGPRSGGIPGVFHGPLWYYISLIPFIFTQGNPVLMGWFWWSFAVAATLLFYLCLRSTTKKTLASLVTTIGFALLLIPSATGPVNNFVADLFGFFILFIWWRWLQRPTFWLAAIGWFSLGLLVQFQMAFSVPLAVVWSIGFAFQTLKTRRWRELITPIFFLLPLATFFLFDLRHDWLQVRSVIQYLQVPPTDAPTLLERIPLRLNQALREAPNIFQLPWASTLFIFFVAVLGWRSQKRSTRSLVGIFLFWYAGWWTISLGFSGAIWSYYYTPFLGMFFFLTGIILAEHKRLVYATTLLILLLAVVSSHAFLYQKTRFDGSSWRLLQHIAAESLDTPNRGYFLYSQDQFVYPLKYAFSYHQKTHPEIEASSFKKRAQTIVVKAPDDPNNPFMTEEIWQIGRIHLNQNPDWVKEYPFGYRLEHYTLDETAQQIPIDPNLILDLHFR